ITRMNLYRLNPAEKSTGVKKKHLMLRPGYPQIYHKSQMPDVSDFSEVVGILDRPWKAGDMVDWLKDGCYWSACIADVQDDDIVQVQCPRAPAGEGGSYVVPCKELRPSLDWTPELGWTAPISKVTSEPCVRLVHPKNPGRIRNSIFGTGVTSPFKFSPSSVSSHGSASSFPPGFSSVSSDRKIPIKPSGGLLNKQKTGSENTKNGGADKTTSSLSVSSSHGDTCESVSGRNKLPPRDRSNSRGSFKKMRKSETEPNSTMSDMIESSIMDLEELVNRVKWLKGALEYGAEFSTTMKPSWKFLETHASPEDG
ncbi:hypothetical protein MKW94_024425, partial [Papaver nudicaule]|nr:hypothetical protein [Papaver nudicaule]